MMRCGIALGIALAWACWARADEVPAGYKLAAEIIYARDQQILREIWILERTDSTPLVCPERETGVGDPSLSGNGQRVAYAFGPESRSGVAIIGVDGSDHKVIFEGKSTGTEAEGEERAFRRPRFNPAADRLLVTERISSWKTSIAENKTSVKQRLHVVDLRTGEAKELVFTPDVDPEGLDWARDAGRVLVRGTAEGGETALWWAKADGTQGALGEPLCRGEAARAAGVVGSGKLVVAQFDAARRTRVLTSLGSGPGAKPQPLFDLIPGEEVRAIAGGPKDDWMAVTITSGNHTALIWCKPGSKVRYQTTVQRRPDALGSAGGSWGRANRSFTPGIVADAKDLQRLATGLGLEKCPECKGKGELIGPCKRCQGSGSMKCPNCEGAGAFPCRVCDATGRKKSMAGEVACPGCSGRGKIVCVWCQGKLEVRCYLCEGKKEVPAPCKRCHGLGQVRVQDVVARDECKACKSHGVVECVRCQAKRNRPGPCPECIKGVLPCPLCRGAYKIPCERCFGNGYIIKPGGKGQEGCKACDELGVIACRTCVKGVAKCPSCRGTSRAMLMCDACNATGQVLCPHCTEEEPSGG